MNLFEVQSSAIAAIGFQDGVLAVQFHTSDTIYEHPHVPPEIFEGLMQAESKGEFYNQNIRGRYQ
jgi:hypothetical protein